MFLVCRIAGYKSMKKQKGMLHSGSKKKQLAFSRVPTCVSVRVFSV
jgi:hypothetical protein